MVIADAESPGPLRKRPRLSLRFPKAGTSQKDKLSGPDKKDECRKETREISGETEEVQELSMNDETGYDSEKEEKVVPAVSSLENLGNTCFLNSVLQVLRYTPGFLDGLEDLHGEILLVEKWQKQDTASKELHEDLSYELSQSQTCDMMKHLHKLYRLMERREARHSEVASSDVMSMALKPDKILNTLRELNPMFEGNLQHDAQELLRCMLCYLQDAVKEIKKIKSRLPPSALPQSKGPLNPIMQKFLSNGKPEKKCQDVPNHASMKKAVQLPAVEIAKSTPKTDFLDEIEKSESAKTASSEETMDVVEADIPDFTLKVGLNKDQDSCLVADSKQEVLRENISAVPKRLRSRRTQPPSPVKKTRDKMSEKLDETDGDPILRRKRVCKKCTEKDAADVKSQIKTEQETTSSSSGRCKTKGMSNCIVNGEVKCEKVESDNCGKTKGMSNCIVNGEVKCEKVQSENCGTKCSSQPSILSMLTGEKPCKRLGMRGASMKNNQNNSSCNGSVQDKVSEKTASDIHLSKQSSAKPKKRKVLTAFGDRTQPVDASDVTSSINTSNSSPSKEGTKSPKKLVNKVNVKQELDVSEKESSQLSSEFQKLKCENITNSPKNKRQPLVKLEKCDHVCDSPKKSVNADYAEKTLSPMKSSGSSKSTIMVGNAKQKLDFSPGGSRYVSPADKLYVKPLSKVDFVENLFMGKMMLRTKCLECEFSRERIEEFHDISVPLKKEKGANDEEEEEEDMDSDEEDNSCLKKMMDAFSEVERLRDENKYYCDKCIRHVEAERSLHYEVLPDVLSLHLKRFSASSGLYGYVSKINDHVTIPLSLPCLRYKCPSPCSRPDHRYMLYGLVTHAGVTLTSGHYLSYVRVLGSGQPKLGAGDSPSITGSCKGNQLSSRSGFLRSPPGENQRSGLGTKYPNVPKQMYEEQWLECDDETIRMYSKQEFCNLLKGEGGSLLGTPYVLFYHRVIPGVHW